MNNRNTAGPQTRRPGGLLRTLSSIWFGIATLVLLLIYASLGSALAPLRGALELTEMQVFQHWLFVVLIGLFTLSLVAATLTRIRWRALNGGALTVHVGLLLLVLGSAWYFGHKVEGDVLLISPRIELLGQSSTAPAAELPAVKGKTWEQVAPMAAGRIELAVTETRPHGNDPVAEATVRATFGSTPPQFVDLVANGPAQPLGSGLALRMRTFAPQSRFCDDDAPVLYYGRQGQRLDHSAALTGLPLHRERYLPDEGSLRDTAGQPVPSQRFRPELALGRLVIPTGWLEPWRMPIKLDTPELPCDVEVTGYVPYIAGLESAVAGDGPTENPIVKFRLEVGAQSVEPTLMAFSPDRSRLDLGVVFEFRWVRSEAELAAALQPPASATASTPAGRVLILAGRDVPPTLAVFAPSGAIEQRKLEPGRKGRLGLPDFDVDFTLLAIHRNGRFISQPTVQPVELRRPSMGRRLSAIRLRLSGRDPYAGWSATQWCTFSEYPHLDASAAPDQLAARPAALRLPDGNTYEFLYSRAERDLGATLVPGALRVKHFPGHRRAESWQSDFFVQTDPRQMPVPAIVRTNQTYTLGPWTLFQSGADPADWGWTILGVGNRRGMWPMGLGCVLITVGCVYAFYVKPVLRRRAAARPASGQNASSAPPAASVAAELEQQS